MAILAFSTLALGFAGTIWMAVIAFHQGHNWWAIGCILLGIIFATIYGVRNFDYCKFPTVMCIAGFGGRILLKSLGQ